MFTFPNINEFYTIHINHMIFPYAWCFITTMAYHVKVFVFHVEA